MLLNIFIKRLKLQMNEYFKEKLTLLKKDENQLEAYLSNINTVVLAGPGSGKTTVLTLKIMRLLTEAILPPRGLACVTFSNEASKEFTERLFKLGYAKRKNVFLGTVHTFCIAEIILPFAHLYHYDFPLPFKLISERKKKSLFTKILNEMNIQSADLRIEEMDKERSLNIKGISKIRVPSYDVALKVAKEYEHRIHSVGLVDFMDIVGYATLLIQEQEYVRKCLSAKFPWVLIDEYQDLGRPLHEMVLALFGKADINIFAVGDPDQSIYGFTGAIPDFLLELTRDKNIKVVKLSTNYRSNQDIIDASELVLKPKSERKYIAGTRKSEKADFQFITCEEGLGEQCAMVTGSIITECIHKGIPLEEICVLVGTNYELDELKRFFESVKLPFYIPKHRFKRTEVIKWLEKCSMWVADNLQQSFDELYNFWFYLNQEHLEKNLCINNPMVHRRKLYNILTGSSEYKNDIRSWVSYILEGLELLRLLDESQKYEDDLDNLKELTETLKEDLYENGYDIMKFANIGKPIKQVTLTTRHSSKGLEFEVVVMLGMEEGSFPSYRAISSRDTLKLLEEHRVCFVCVSRAKRRVFLLRSNFRTIPTKRGPWRKPFQPSRFWETLYSQYGVSTEEQFMR